ncbi:preprotein translocase subunit SecA [Patescibacteria group bacterium]|nr:preprotein translocase subunit SecA [Patescibacteria group bacterium]
MFDINRLFQGQSPLLKEAEKLVPRINALEPDFKAKSDDDLKAVTQSFRERLSQGETLDQLLPEAFAAVREASRRTLNERHYDVQLIGGYVLHNHSIAEMRTGEGKTLVGTLPVYLNALTGKGVHVVTVNDYLARRDAAWMGQVYTALGLTVGIINHDASYIYDPAHSEKDSERDEVGSFKVVYDFLRPVSRKEAYGADVTYGTNNEFGFDYLRDNLEYEPENIRQRNHYMAVVDEVDSILIDEARTPLIISGPARDAGELYKTFAIIVRSLKEGDDYTVDEKLRTVIIADSGIEKAEKALGLDNLYAEGGTKYAHHLESAVKAQAVYIKDKDYVVKDGNVVIVDEFTGRLQPGRRWSEGLHQAIEAKEGVSVQKESQTYASVTFQNYFRMYEKVAGMTGTGLTSAEEFRAVYNLDVVAIPTHRPVARKDSHDLIFQSEAGKFKAIVRAVKERNTKGQPVLIGTTSIEVNERLASALRAAGVPHQMLNAKNHEREGEIIAQAGIKGGVTVATNMAGRGVDIKLGGNPTTPELYEEVKNLGGLYVIGTERHDARRIDNQLRGRAGRQGDPGETQFFVSLEDKLMRIFASDSVKGMMGSLGIPEDEPIQSGIVTRTLESAQEKIEGVNFDSRKHVLGFDDVLNHQRTLIYAKRRGVLLGDAEAVEALVRENIEKAGTEVHILEEKKTELGDAFIPMIKRALLQTYDMFWIEHLETMEHLRGSVNLRSYGGKDPFIEYRREGLRLFRDLENSLAVHISEQVSRLGTHTHTHEVVPRVVVSQLANAKDKIGRNDHVTITDGKETRQMKYKKAEPLLTKGWKIVEKK